VSCAKTDEAIEMLFDVDLGGPKKTSIRWGAHGHNLMNTTEPSM